MKTRAKMRVSIREKAVSAVTLNRSLCGKPADTMRIEAQSTATVSVEAVGEDMIDIEFASPGFWGTMSIPKTSAFQFAMDILNAGDFDMDAFQEDAR